MGVGGDVAVSLDLEAGALRQLGLLVGPNGVMLWPFARSCTLISTTPETEPA